MMTVTEKAAYLKGLAEMAHFDQETDETKLIKAMIDVIDEMALSIADLEDTVAALEEEIDMLDEDLEAVEDYVFDDDYDDCDCCCDDDCVEVECPACHEIICLDDSMLDEDTIQCPACGELLEFDFDCDCDECDGCDED